MVVTGEDGRSLSDAMKIRVDGRVAAELNEYTTGTAALRVLSPW